jgi:tetratricopeptide (TPR) repeat protein
MALKGIAERPVLGWGQENFNFVFNKNYDPQMFGQEEWFDRTHNVVLDWLIAGGILGFASYALIYIALLYYVWRKESTLKYSEKSVLTGLIIAYVFHNLFVFDNLISYLMFFTVLALVHHLNKQSAVSTSAFYTKIFNPDTTNYISLPIVAVLTVVVIYFVNVPAISANTTLIKAMTPQQSGVDQNIKLFKEVFAYGSFGDSEATEQLVTITSQVSQAQSGVTDAQKQEFYNLAKEKVEAKIASTPNDARYLVFAGSFFNRFGQYDEAIKYLERALVESPRKQTVKFELGSSYIGKKEYQKTFDLFKSAYESKPSSKESTVLYALAAIYTKNDAVLKELSAGIDQDTVVFDNRFLNTYANIGDYGSVLNILNARLEKEPKNTQYRLSLASVYSTLGQKDKAISVIRAIIADDPTFKDQGEYYIKEIQAQ